MMRHIFFIFWAFLVTQCTTLPEPSNAEEAFALAKKPFDDESYEQALEKLGAFKNRFPYSKWATEAELLIANSHFLLKRYPEAIEAYGQFRRLHPQHPQGDFVLFRIGECHWAEAPESPSREQEYTEKAIQIWQEMAQLYPHSPYIQTTAERIASGKKRVFDNHQLIARFYCKQKIWHACAYRFLHLIEKYPDQQEALKEGLLESSKALEMMLKEKPLAQTKRDREKTNFFFKTMEDQEIEQKILELRQRAKNLGG
jgi:outer membrane protein assembly factor BamD